MEQFKLPTRHSYIIPRYKLKRVREPILDRTMCANCGKRIEGEYNFDGKPYISAFRDNSGYVCQKCENEMIVEKLKYGLYLRFIPTHFNPCESCQEEIHKIILTSKIELGHSPEIVFSKGEDNRIVFAFDFVGVMWLPCEGCEKKIINMLRTCPLIIGNTSSEPAVELWRKWDIDDKLTEKLITGKEYK